MNNQLTAPSKIPKVIKQITESAAPPPSAGGVAGMGGDAGGSAGGVMGGILGGIGTAAPVVKAAPPKRINVSGGVIAGNILVKTQPQYPAIAKAARIQGTVVLQATISKSGTIQGLQVSVARPCFNRRLWTRSVPGGINLTCSMASRSRWEPQSM